ncbi:MAG: bifunctional salicylyl-CoA 5-hydroxylase/oxidoreductase [Deltaproteobacteria bacterium]|nr:bifunctional salicylyl-CoA 5-hydroxylase/oxidoreductase [Deltaproteobacteria bacterium]
MKVVCLGGGPAGLFTAVLLKQADARHQVTVYERNRPDDTFGFGVVFSDATEEAIAKADPLITTAMGRHAHRWDDIEIHYRGETVVSTGHGFSGLSRQTLLNLLHERCEAAGVELVFGHEVDDAEAFGDADLVVAADGVASKVRERYKEHFRPSIDERPNRFVWLGTTRPFPAFTFYFKNDAHGLWRVHAYQYEPGASTFIVETTDAAWRAAGLEGATEAQTLAFCERLFAEELQGHRLIANRSIWRRFPVIKNARWHHGKVVLLGDAVHTAHFSVGSGTKLAMEDAIALVGALQEHRSVAEALPAYEAARRPAVDSLQRAAQVSMAWFEDAERYQEQAPLQFAVNLLTRSLRVTHENLKLRDPAFVERVDDWFAERAAQMAGSAPPEPPAPPPMFTPFKLRGMALDNRVAVSPMCQYSAEDGTPNDWHLVHYGSRAIGGAGLLFTEMTDVSAEGRISPGCTGLYKPEHATAWRRITDFVHANSRAKIAVQLGHAGRKASTHRGWEGDNVPLKKGGWPIVAASPLPYFADSPVPQELDLAGMKGVVADFVRAARLAEDAGFDMLELHMAHGYLLAGFLSPLTNRRTDEYGGSLERRLRFPLEVFDAVRAAWPAERPMSVRLSAVDWAPGGMAPADAVEVARALKAHGCDVVDVSAGQTVPDQQPVYGRLFQTPFADRIRAEVGIATMAVGNISSYTDVNTILAAGRADLCLLARAHLYDPYWTRHAAVELGHPQRWPDPYNALDRYRPRFT